MLLFPSALLCQYKQIPSNLLPKEQIVADKKNGYDLTNELPRNFVTNGTSDYTSFLQRGIESHAKVIFPNFPILINDTGINLISNSTVIFQPNSVLILKPSSNENYQILRVYNAQNIKIYSPQIKGDKYAHQGKTGQWGMGISIRSSENIVVYNAKVEQCWGDGIYIGALNSKASDYSNNITIDGCVINDNRRNGISITSAIGVIVKNSLISNTNGTAPKGGLDIEPSNANESIKDIQILNLATYNNGGGGIIISLKRLVKKNASTGITIDGHKDYKSLVGLRIGGYSSNPITTKAKKSALDGFIIIKNSDWHDNKREPILINNYQNLSPIVSFSNNNSYKNNIKINLLDTYSKVTKDGIRSSGNRIKLNN